MAPGAGHWSLSGGSGLGFPPLPGAATLGPSARPAFRSLRPFTAPPPPFTPIRFASAASRSPSEASSEPTEAHGTELWSRQGRCEEVAAARRAGARRPGTGGRQQPPEPRSIRVYDDREATPAREQGAGLVPPQPPLPRTPPRSVPPSARGSARGRRRAPGLARSPGRTHRSTHARPEQLSPPWPALLSPMRTDRAQEDG